MDKRERKPRCGTHNARKPDSGVRDIDDVLPSDVVGLIGTFLSQEDVNSGRLVNRRWATDLAINREHIVILLGSTSETCPSTSCFERLERLTRAYSSVKSVKVLIGTPNFRDGEIQLLGALSRLNTHFRGMNALELRFEFETNNTLLSHSRQIAHAVVANHRTLKKLVLSGDGPVLLPRSVQYIVCRCANLEEVHVSDRDWDLRLRHTDELDELYNDFTETSFSRVETEAAFRKLKILNVPPIFTDDTVINRYAPSLNGSTFTIPRFLNEPCSNHFTHSALTRLEIQDAPASAARAPLPPRIDILSLSFKTPSEGMTSVWFSLNDLRSCPTLRVLRLCNCFVSPRDYSGTGPPLPSSSAFALTNITFERCVLVNSVYVELFRTPVLPDLRSLKILDVPHQFPLEDAPQMDGLAALTRLTDLCFSGPLVMPKASDTVSRSRVHALRTLARPMCRLRRLEWIESPPPHRDKRFVDRAREGYLDAACDALRDPENLPMLSSITLAVCSYEQLTRIQDVIHERRPSCGVKVKTVIFPSQLS
jgi:hypothetical protein